MSLMASQITSLTIVYSTVYPGADQRKHQSSASLAFVREIHRSPVNSPHKGPVTRKMFPFDDAIMRPILIQVYVAICMSPAHNEWMTSTVGWVIFCSLSDIISWVNTLRPRQNGRHFADDIFKWIFLNENVWIPIEISLKFAPQGPINNIPALVQIMAWRLPGDKPLSGPMMVSLLTHICVSRPQWVKDYTP